MEKPPWNGDISCVVANQYLKHLNLLAGSVENKQIFHWEMMILLSYKKLLNNVITEIAIWFQDTTLFSMTQWDYFVRLPLGEKVPIIAFVVECLNPLSGQQCDTDPQLNTFLY